MHSNALVKVFFLFICTIPDNYILYIYNMPCNVMRLRVGLYIRLKFNAYKFESIRRQRKLSQLDVADLSGVSKRTIASIGQAVKGGAISGLNFHLNTISSLAKSLDVPPLSLIIESEAETFNPNPEDIFI